MSDLQQLSEEQDNEIDLTNLVYPDTMYVQ